MILRFSLSLSIIFSFIVLETSAQTEAGSFLLGGNLSFTTLQEKEERTLSLMPAVGYFVLNNFAVELKPSFTLGFFRDDFIERSRGLAIAVGVRYYFKGENLRPLLLVEQNWGRGRTIFKDEIPFGGELNIHTRTFSAGAGAAYFLVPNFALEGLLTYQNTNTVNRNPVSPTEVEFNFITFVIGAKFFFSRNSKK